MRRDVRKRTFGHVRPANCGVCSESSLGAVWIANDAKFLHTDDVQTDLSLCLAQISEGTFSHGSKSGQLEDT